MSAGVDLTKIGAEVSLLVSLMNDCLEALNYTAQHPGIPETALCPRIPATRRIIQLAHQAFRELSQLAARIAPPPAPWDVRLQAGLSRSRELLSQLSLEQPEPGESLYGLSVNQHFLAARATVRQLSTRCNFHQDPQTAPGHEDGWQFLETLLYRPHPGYQNAQRSLSHSHPNH